MAADKLSLYQAKRDFTKTAEPSGTARVKPAKYPRFVIQKHAASRLHYDLRLEVDGVFKSGAFTKGPSLDPRDRRLTVLPLSHTPSAGPRVYAVSPPNVSRSLPRTSLYRSFEKR
jgi:DNA ligase D-like protein (predicted 3'-phosphoesterase)